MKPSPALPRGVHRTLLAAACALAGVLSAPAQQAPAAPATTGTEPRRDEVVTLSPFVVNSGNDTGYFSENTLAGSRLNTRVADLAASITVVTKQQLLDTGSIDMNDVFLYEANTEGTGNYTDFNIDTRGAIQDRNAGFQGGAPSLPFGPTSSNRVRGIGSVDRLHDYYPSNQRIPFDVYNTDSVEINRGPNSLLFGLGSAAGIVNQSSARANLRRQSYHVDTRIGSDDAFRASFNANYPIIADKLAVHVAALHDERGFARKPSHDITRRQYGALTFKPFEKTTIRASFEHYDNDNRRPNSVTPRDFVSGWIAAGRPSYNPITNMLSRSGTTTGPYVLNNAASITALQLASGNTIDVFGNSRPVLMIEQGVEQRFIMQTLSSTPTVATTPAAFNFNSAQRTTRSLGPISRTNIPPAGVAAGITFAQPGISDQSLYDWESINIISGNFGRDTANIYNVELEQEILPNLFLQAGWYREDFKSDINYYISQQTGVTLYVDTDTVLPDGTTNPNFGRPYIEVTQPDRFLHPEDNMTGRVSLAYELDLSRKEGLLGWLGKHRVMGLWQHNQIKRDQHRYRPYVSSNHVFNPVVADIWAGNTFQNAIERRFYVGDNTGRVTQDPGLYPNGSRTHAFRWYNPITAAWQNDNVQVDTGLHFVSNRSHQEIKSKAVALQSNFLKDRLVTTFGWREDKSDARSSAFGATRLPNGQTNPALIGVFGAPQVVSGETTSYGGVFRPFAGWQSLDSGGGSYVGNFVRSLGFHYNQSDNFAPAAQQTDFFNNFLPFPTGEGKDWGVSFSLFEDKLVARLNFFEASQNMARGALVAQPLTRTQTVDDVMFRQWAQMVTGQGPTSTAVMNILQLPAFHAAQPAGVFFNVPVAATSTVNAEGLEFQLTYNPTRNWNIKFTAGQQETIFSAIGPEFDAWMAARMPIWTAAAAAGRPNFWNTTGTDFTNAGFPSTGVGATQRVQDWFFTNVDAIVKTAKRNEGKVTPDQREWRWNVITNYQFLEGRLKGFGVGGAARWEGEAAIGYLAAPADPDGIIRSLDNNRPVFDDSQFHLDVWLSYAFKGLPWVGDDVRTKVQLNVRDALENGGLEPIAVNPDGRPSAFRIKDPRQWFLSVALDF